MNQFLSILTKMSDETDAGITFLSGNHSSVLSYSELLSSTPYTAGKLISVGVKEGQYVVFQLTDNRELIEMFWACIWMGAIPVAVPPALSANDEDRVKKTLEMLPEAIMLADRRTASHLPNTPFFLASDVLEIPMSKPVNPYSASGDSIRLIQMSSGSTGYPKGIIVDERTLMSAMDATTPRRTEHYQNSMLTWLPLSHNLSLLGFHVYAMFRGFPQILMSIADFIMNPFTWCEAITKYRPTITVCPNFGFVHVLRYLKARGIPAGQSFDLSSIQKMVSASEPIDMKTAEAFLKVMKGLGLRENTIVAAYGMSEACLQISTTGIYEPLQCITLERSEVRIGARYEDIACPDGAIYVSVGKTVPGMEISLRDDEGVPLNDGTVGEICIRGTSLTTASITCDGIAEHPLYSDGFFATGDIGIVWEGNLYVVARKKDIIFINGKNYYSPDLESLLMAELEQDTVVLGRTSPLTGEEEVVVFVPRGQDAVSDREISAVLATKAGIPVSRVVRVSEIPRAANGKKMRRALEALL